MQLGDRVRIRTEDKSIKLWGRVTNVETHTEEVDVTRSGLFGGPVDTHRRVVAGRTSVRLTIEVEPVQP